MCADKYIITSTNLKMGIIRRSMLTRSGLACLPSQLSRSFFSGKHHHQGSHTYRISLYMDARKHLRGLGWKGDGHSLGKNANGIKKPLLITHKTGLHGLGAKSQKEKQADQWWLNAFDSALKDIGTGKESSLTQVREHGGKGGLYRFFVRGKGLEGTIDEESGVRSTRPMLFLVCAGASLIVSSLFR